MKDLLEISCGLDIHKEKIVACILTGPLGKPTHSEIREFTTLIPDMLALRDWIISENCHHIAILCFTVWDTKTTLWDTYFTL